MQWAMGNTCHAWREAICHPELVEGSKSINQQINKSTKKMCGISGIIKSNRASVNEADLDQMILILNHRGPDASAKAIYSNVGLAHNRLSLLDLSAAANQPFKNDFYSLVFNGEIYNWKTLKLQLEQEGVLFKTTSDTEVLFEALQNWGIEKTLPLLKGMFAFAWFDINNQNLTLVRDRLGIKPLFFGNLKGDFYFASEIKALAANLGMEDMEFQYLAQAYYGVYETQRHISPFKKIKQLEPGHFLRIDTNTMEAKLICWFSLDMLVDEQEYRQREKKSSKEITEEFEHIFKNSVQSMAIADAPIGTFVSGGIDSSIVAATTKEFGNLELFTANVLGKHSEFEAATLLSNHLNLPLHEYKYEPENFLRDVVDCTWNYDAPINLFTNSVAFSGVAKIAREKNIKAVLTGEGADEMFLGYPKLLTAKWDGLINSPYNLINGIYKSIPGLSSYLKINAVDFQKEVLQSQMNGNKERHNDWKVLQSYDFLKNEKESFRCASLSVNMLHRHLHSLLWRNDRIGMMYSIESRFPFLDEDMIKFSLNLPNKFKIGKTNSFYNWKHPFHIDKLTVRNYGNKILPKELVKKKKSGFGVDGYTIKGKSDYFGFFKNGFWQQACEMSDSALQLMIDNTEQKLLNKLVSVEIWGLMAGLKFSPTAVKNKVNSSFVK